MSPSPYETSTNKYSLSNVHKVAARPSRSVANNSSPAASPGADARQGVSEGMGVTEVELPEINLRLPLKDRPLEALRVAQEAFAQTGYWIAFYRAILGASGAVSQLFPTDAEREFFLMTPEHEEILQMLTALRTSDKEKADAVEPLRMITLRIPSSLQDNLIAEAKLRRTSVNKLCISKLLIPTSAEHIPAESGRVRGRKPRSDK